MRPTFSLLLMLTLSGGMTTAAVSETLVDNPSYRASGSPGWEVEIGDDIVLRLGQNLDDSENLLIVDYRYPAVLARHHGDVRRWRSGGSRGILVEVRPGPCTSPGGQVLPDHVRVVHPKGEWQGCGESWSGDNSR